MKLGYFNTVLPSILETLAPPPTGDVVDLAEARRLLDRRICTKGNLDIGLLWGGPPAEIAAETRGIMAATRGYPLMMGTADAVIWGTPPENVRVMVQTAKEYAPAAVV